MGLRSRADPQEGNGVKKPLLRLAWIALLVFVVTLCVYSFAGMGAQLRQSEAVAAHLADPERDGGGPMGAAPVATTLARAERHSITETLAVSGSPSEPGKFAVGAEGDRLRTAK